MRVILYTIPITGLISFIISSLYFRYKMNRDVLTDRMDKMNCLEEDILLGIENWSEKLDEMGKFINSWNKTKFTQMLNLLEHLYYPEAS
jgi:hypothetical protein